jgi:aspartate aminotransferase
MTGWRIGYTIAEKDLIKQMIKLNQITTTCVPPFIQYGALKGLESRKQIAENIRTQFKIRADAAYSVLSKSKMKFSSPDAPFYLFPKVDGLDSERFALDLLDKGVAVAPGTAFGDYREYFRIALTVGEHKIKEGLGKLCEALP